MATDAVSPDSKMWTIHHQTDAEMDPFDESDPLSWILGFPHAEVLFLGEILGRRALLCRDVRRDRFRELVSPEVSNRDLETQAPGPGESAVVLETFDERHEPLGRLCAAFARQAGALTWADLHLSFPAPRGPRPLWEAHDTFVMQVDGSTRWRIYEGGREAPTGNLPLHPAAYRPGPVAAELTLSAGDALYVPRGILHAAEARENAALHIALISLPYTWSQFLRDCLEDLTSRSRRWRDSLPYGFAQQAEMDFGPIRDELKSRLLTLPYELDSAAILAAWLDDVGAAARRDDRSGDA
ncbi:JmjC domain-containing protein [Candidatus Palauibacter sp.]|uniref:JmjC domain-containing protein n=1 Tax=Candidatus Palauibacter sp. TaxID=3101350 RepID=UPI003B596424